MYPLPYKGKNNNVKSKFSLSAPGSGNNNSETQNILNTLAIALAVPQLAYKLITPLFDC